MEENGSQSVEEMMDRLKKRFKAAGLQTKSDSFSDGGPGIVADETRCVTQLRTYVKLCRTMGAAFVINEKARHEIFESIKVHSSSANVLTQALICLNLLLVDSQKDARKSSQVTFEVYDGAFAKILQVVNPHLGDAELALELLKFLRMLFGAQAVAYEIVKKEAEIVSAMDKTMALHSSAEISQLVNEIRIQLEACKASPMLSSTAGIPVARASTMDEFQLLADGDLLGDLDLGAMNTTPIASDTGGMSFPNSAIATSHPPSGDYVPKAELDEARRTIMQYQVDIQALGTQLSQMQLSYQADQEVHRSFVTRLQEAEANFRRDKIESQQKIGTLEQVNTSLNEKVQKMKEELKQKEVIVANKNREFEQMKTLISNQMDQARAHFMSLQQEHVNVKNLNTTLQETAKAAQTRAMQLQDSLKTRNTELEEAQSQVNMWQNKCESAQHELVTLQEDNNKLTHGKNEAYTKLQEEHGKLVNQHQNLFQLNETLKQQFVNLKMEYNQLQQRSSANLEVYKKEAKIKKLEQEKSELLSMMEVLLAQSNA